MIGNRPEDPGVAEGAEVGDHQEQGEQKAEVAYAIENERLHACRGGRWALVVKTYEQIRREPDTLPADKHEQEVLRQHQRQHEEHEEVEISKEAPVAVFLCHVADGVDMDHKAHAGNHQKHDEGQGIEQEVKVGAKGRSRNPGGREPLDMRKSEAAEVECDV